MVDTIKFSQMAAGGDLANNDKVPGLGNDGMGNTINVLYNNPWTFLSPGTTAQRPTPSAAINYRLRFNTDDQLYEYYDAVLGMWTQLQESAFTVGPFITYTADASLPDAQNLGLLSNGILKQTITTGVATLDIAVNGTDYYGPGFTGFFQSPAGVKDVDGNIVFECVGNLSAVNYLSFANRSAGLGPIISANGLDVDIQLNLQSTGEGAIALITEAANNALIVLSGTSSQHETIFSFQNTTNTVNIGFQDATGTVAFLSDIPSVTPSALTSTDDTNVTLTLGGSPNVALLAATSLTLGWTGQLSPARGGSGVNNGSSTLTLAGNLATIGAFASNFTMTGATNVTFPTSGTLATTSQLPSPAALTKTDDTNVTLTLGGTPTTALLQATSLTLGWTGQLGLTRGGSNASLTASNGGIVYSTATAMAILAGTATANLPLLSGSTAAPSWGAFALSLGGALTTAGAYTLSGAFASTFTFTNTTSVTFPTAGTLATTSQIPTGAALTETDDTNVTLTLGGSPTTALINAASLTLGWTGTLSGTRGGTGVNNGANTATFAGNLNFANSFTTSGNFAVTQTYTGITNVTFPTSGTLATTSGTVSSVSGTTNQIGSTGGTTPVISLASNPIVPGTGGIQIPGGTTAQRAGAAGTIRFNSQLTLFESTVDGTNWATIETSAIGVTSISGTSNQVIASAATGNITLSLPQSIATTSAVQFASVSFSSTSGIIGTTTNNSAAAGSVGELISSVIPNASAASWSFAIATNLTTISLTAGDWDVYGNIFLIATSISSAAVWISKISNTVPDPSLYNVVTGTFGSAIGLSAPYFRASLSGTTTIYLSGSAGGTGSLTAQGGIYARRVR